MLWPTTISGCRVKSCLGEHFQAVVAVGLDDLVGRSEPEAARPFACAQLHGQEVVIWQRQCEHQRLPGSGAVEIAVH
jgi:hypothetical protein